MDSSCEELYSCLFLHQSDNKRYKLLKEQQHNALLMGDKKYIEKILKAKILLKYWQVPTSAHQAPIENKED